MANLYTPCPGCRAINRVDRDKARGSAPVCSACKTALRVDGSISNIDGAGLEALVQKSPLPVVADFWAAWCGPCKMFAPTFAQAAEDLSDSYVFVKVDTEADPSVSARYAIRGIPALILFAGGAERARQAGAMDPASFRRWLQQAAAA